MKIALDPTMMQSQDVHAAVRSAAAAGYQNVELGNRNDFIPAFGPLRATPGELHTLRDTASAEGVDIASVAVIQSWSNPDAEARARSIRWWKEGIAASVELGCRRINTELAGHPQYPNECRAAFLRSIEELLPVLDREDVEVVVEPHPWDFLAAADAARLGALEIVPLYEVHDRIA